MRAATSTNRVRGLLPQAVVATVGVVVLPAFVALALVMAGLPEPEIAIATTVGLALACCAAAVGTAMWIKRKESVEVSFGELMLWRWLRRHRAEDKIDETAQVLVHPVRHSLSEAEQLEMLHELSTALEVKDPYTHGHSRRVERHSYRTAMAMSLPAERIEELRLAAALHDVGKIDVPDAILRKPGPLTDDELQLVQAHPVVGAELVKPAASQEVTEAVLHHHESWDGTGYPNGLSGEGIPLAARIIAVADAYDAITSARPYKAGSARRDAVAVLEAGAGSQFDPDVVKAFISTLPSAVPALASLLLLAWPARMVRKGAVWAKGAGAGSVATAATSAGVAVMLGTTGLGLVQERAPMPAPVVAPVVDERSGDESGSVPAVEVRKTTKKSKITGNVSLKSGPIVAGAPQARNDAGSANEVAPPASDQEDPPAPAPEPAEEPTESPEGKYEPFSDPQPDKGRECEKGKGPGLEDHCDDTE